MVHRLRDYHHRIEMKISVTQRRLSFALRQGDEREQAELRELLRVLRDLRNQAEDTLVLLSADMPRQHHAA